MIPRPVAGYRWQPLQPTRYAKTWRLGFLLPNLGRVAVPRPQAGQPQGVRMIPRPGSHAYPTPCSLAEGAPHCGGSRAANPSRAWGVGVGLLHRAFPRMQTGCLRQPNQGVRMIPRPGCHGGVVAASTREWDHAAVRISEREGRGWELIQARQQAGLSQGVG